MEAIRAEKARRRIEVREAGGVEATRARCAKSLLNFVRDAWPVVDRVRPFVFGWHIDFICKHLEAITRGKFLKDGFENRLLINIPPSFAKSIIVSVLWPAWEWGPAGLPSMQYIATSHRNDFCRRDSDKMRGLILSDWYQRHWPVRLVSFGVERFANDRGGFREAIPFGSLMGGKCDRLLIDDPHSIDTAESDAERDAVVTRFRESALLRVNDPIKSAIVLIMQRLHDKDLSGTILALGMPFIHVMLPMRYDPGRRCVTPLGEDRRTIPGDLLFPERFPRAVVDRDEKGMTAYAVASQHQQSPQPRGGFMFKRWWFKEVKGVPPSSRWVRGWDLAASERTTAAFTAGVLLAYNAQERRYYIADVVREQTGNPEKFIRRIAERDGTTVEVSIPQDPGAAGKIQAAALCAALAGWRVQASPESGDKVARAQPVADQAEIGNISIVKGPWNEDFLNEIEKFPTGMFLDQVDALSRAFGYYVLRPGAVIAAPIVVTSPLIIHGTNEGPQ